MIHDTGCAAKHVAFHQSKDVGAVASMTAAKIYGLNILAQDIQDDSDNITRFLMLAREPIIPGTDKPFKTSIVFYLEEGPGMLFMALAVFAMRNINLTKIESRPLQKQALQTLDGSSVGSPKHFPYLFYVEFEALMVDERSQNALGHLNICGCLGVTHLTLAFHEGTSELNESISHVFIAMHNIDPHYQITCSIWRDITSLGACLSLRSFGYFNL